MQRSEPCRSSSKCEVLCWNINLVHREFWLTFIWPELAIFTMAIAADNFILHLSFFTSCSARSLPQKMFSLHEWHLKKYAMHCDGEKKNRSDFIVISLFTLSSNLCSFDSLLESESFLSNPSFELLTLWNGSCSHKVALRTIFDRI